MGYELVVVGVSAGGLQALCTIAGALTPDFEMAMVIVQHRSKDSYALCDVLQDCTRIPMHEIIDKEPIAGGQIYLAPPDYHVLVEPGFFSLSVDEPIRHSRPSIDLMFETAADAYGSEVIGIVLTGANHDGAWGLRQIVDRGGTAIVQDPETAEVAVMPRAALAMVPEAHVAPVEEIAPLLLALQRAGSARTGTR
jgi:two-component system, chemotaxis family, protein-glutamate methylesterase/glutaminase